MIAVVIVYISVFTDLSPALDLMILLTPFLPVLSL